MLGCMISSSNFYVGECVICVKSHTSSRLSLSSVLGEPESCAGDQRSKAGGCLLTYWYGVFFFA